MLSLSFLILIPTFALHAETAYRPKLWRDDGVCGDDQSQVLPGTWEPARCDPDGATPCCNQRTHTCGAGPENCECDDCVDYSVIAPWERAGSFDNCYVNYEGCWKDKPDRAIGCEKLDHFHTDVVKRCAKLAVGAGFDHFGVQAGGECYTSRTAWWDFPTYGESQDCTNGTGGPWANSVYRVVCDDKKWANHGHCGPSIPWLDGTPTECDPDSDYPCCPDPSYGICGRSSLCDNCPGCTDYSRN